MKTDDQRPPVVLEQETETNTLDTLLDEHRARPQPRPQPRPQSRPTGPACLVGTVLDDRHPTLLGRVLVRWPPSGDEVQERWLPTLQGLPVRTGDRVLLLFPDGSDDLVVTGVLDGFARRPVPDKASAATIELRRDEAVRLVGSDGVALLEVHQGESGPVLTVLHDDLELASPGRLRVRGRHVQIEAEQGPVEVTATDDVVVRGEVIKLN